MILRDYQEAAIQSVFDEFRVSNSTLVAAAVGSGKTIIQAGFINRVLEEWGRARFICLVHTRELVSQNVEAMRRAGPRASVGVNSAALGSRDTRSQILFASIQSVARHANRIGKADVIIVDESHLIPTTSDTQYRRFISDMQMMNPELKILGLSGTPFRMNSGWLHKGKDAFFDSMCYEIGIPELIEKGHLVPPVNMAMSNAYRTDGLHIRGGDFVAKELQERVADHSKTVSIVNDAIEVGLAEDRKSWICFCAGVEHALETRDAFRSRGISCETVEGNMDAGSRNRILSAFKAGQIRCLTNVNICSIGFNHPPTDMLIMMRPTKSVAMYIQQIGRGLRTSPGKETCRVLDFANVVSSLGPVDAPLVKARDSDKAEIVAPPLKTCPRCETLNHAAKRQCDYCDYEFPPQPIDEKLDVVASTAPILSTQRKEEWLTVTEQQAYLHHKVGSQPSIRIEYRVGRRVYKQWVCLMHGGVVGAKAKAWWAKHVSPCHDVSMGIPHLCSCFNGMASINPIIRQIQVRKKGEYWEVTNWRRND